jgi:hypothetical protein
VGGDVLLRSLITNQPQTNRITMKITTNNHYRFTLDSSDLTAKELKEFDYLTDGEGTFIRYKGFVWELGQFTLTELEGWDGISSDTAFSGAVIKMADDGESVKMGYVYA